MEGTRTMQRMLYGGLIFLSLASSFVARGSYRGTFARSSSNQFRTTVIRGRGWPAGSLIIRNRSPSRDTS